MMRRTCLIATLMMSAAGIGIAQQPAPVTVEGGSVPSAESLRSLDAYFAWRRTPEGETWAK